MAKQLSSQTLIAAAIADKNMKIDQAVALRIGAFGTLESCPIPEVRDKVADPEKLVMMLAEVTLADGLIVVRADHLVLGRSIVYEVFERIGDTPRWKRYVVEAALNEAEKKIDDEILALDAVQEAAASDPLRAEQLASLEPGEPHALTVVTPEVGTDVPISATITVTPREQG